MLARGNKKQKRVACKSGQTNVVHSAGVRMEGGRAGRGGGRRWETAEVGQPKNKGSKFAAKYLQQKKNAATKTKRKTS